ncbi:MAG: alpha/beta hydrolase [Elainellaceae cyanobacterium]
MTYAGAYALTHFRSPGQLQLGMPRPTNAKFPSDIGLDYVTQRISINSAEWLETWFVPAPEAGPPGTILLFPGKGSSKANQLLAPARAFHDLGYDTLLVDFRGVGGSSGDTTTLGIQEAKDVALTLNYAQQNFEPPLVLYGISMGSTAILRAIAAENIAPDAIDAIILELPFARLLDAVRSRLRAVGAPTTLTAEMVVFWGSVQHRFNGFTHNPVTYARQVNCPTLLLHGKLDKWTTMAEIDQIFQSLQGPKQLAIFPNTGHTLLVTVEKQYWMESVGQFLSGV